MVISKFDLMIFSPHRKGVGFRGDHVYDFVLEIMEDKILSKIPDLKKALKKLLKEKAIRNAIKNHTIHNPLSIVKD